MSNAAVAKESKSQPPVPFTRKDMKTENDVRWCPGCGDYAILASIQKTMPSLGVAKEDLVFISGIGCSSRFPYYMNTYGMHSIHGFATDFSGAPRAVRMNTGDGDGFSIVNHMMPGAMWTSMCCCSTTKFTPHQQYSPTSEVGKVAKSTPYGSVDHPVNPWQLSLGAEASFTARVD